MAHLIDKDALVAEIEKIIDILIKNSGCIGAFGENQITVYEDVLSLINTLEVKEVHSDVMQRMEECPYRQVGCTMYEGHILECKGACSWVVDYPRLKKLKAQKGE